MSQIDLRSGNWPYKLTDASGDVTAITREGSFTQAKVPGAKYEFMPDRIKETIEFSWTTPPMLVNDRGDTGVITALSTSLNATAEGTSVALRDAEGAVIWRTAPYVAWDSSNPAVSFNEPVLGVEIHEKSIVMRLNTTMLTTAQWPIYLDPTWTLSAAAGWGSSTFADAVEDKGDHNIKIGWLADNFNDNTNDIWTKETGTWTFASGVMQLQQSTIVRAGSSWSDQRFGFKIRFTATGTAQAYFRFQDSNNHYYLDISQSGSNLTLKKKIAGALTTIATVNGVTITTGNDYVAKVVAAANSFEIWWQGVQKWSGNDSSPSGFTTTYTYDAVGNRIQKQAGSAVVTYAFDADDRLTSITGGPQVLTYIYDANGNRKEDWEGTNRLATYAYDAENRLTQLAYTYTPTGQRMSVASTSTTYYGYDLQGSGGYDDVSAEYNSAGVRQARYTRGSGIDEPIGMLRGGSYYSYQTDAEGSVTRLTDSAQASVNTYRYDAWGRATTESETVSSPFRFTGREKDSGTPLYYYRARTYDSDTGRFTSKDPAGMVDGPNLYNYGGGNAVSRVDPSGRWFEGCSGWECRASPGSSPPGTLSSGTSGSTATGSTTDGPRWTIECTAMTALFLVMVAFAFLGLAMGADIVAQVAYRITTVWKWGIAGAAIFSSPYFLLNTILSIAWWVLWSLIPWWQAIAAGATLAARSNPAGIAITLGLIALQTGIHILGLQAKRCF